MIISDKVANERLSNPMNLFNKVNSPSNGSSKRSMSLFIKPTSPTNTIIPVSQAVQEILPPKQEVIPFKNPFTNPDVKSVTVTVNTESLPKEEEEVSLSDIVDSSEQKIKLELAHDEALSTLVTAVQSLKLKVLEEENPVKLATIVAQMGKVVDQIRASKSKAAASETSKQTHYHFYTPEQKKLSDYQVIDV